jgi:hypothetical protein
LSGKGLELFPWKDEPIDAKQLVGRWKLERIARREPADFKVKEWTIEFTDDGRWRAVGLVIGPWESLQLESSATWRAEGNRIFFRMNDSETECGVKFDHEKLLLFDDPAITPRLRSSAEFHYSRIKE